MFSIISTLLLAGAATAQLTTSFAFLKTNFGTDKLGFYGSVVGVSNDHTTLALVYDNGTDRKALGLGTAVQTITVAPTMFEAKSVIRAGNSINYTNAYDYNLRCDIVTASPDADSTCTASYGPALARAIQCQGNPQRTGTSYTTDLYTYSGRGTYSAGVETIVRTFVLGPNTRSVPDWCSTRSFYPVSGYAYNPTVKRAMIGTYQVVITSGAEKLSATQAQSASVSNATPTSAAGSGSVTPTGSAATGASTGAAMPMKTLGPVMVGLGAAVAAFVV